jgi:hypothetical protein
MNKTTKLKVENLDQTTFRFSTVSFRSPRGAACKFILVRLELNHTVAKIRLALEKMPWTNTLAYSAAMSDMGETQ